MTWRLFIVSQIIVTVAAVIVLLSCGENAAIPDINNPDTSTVADKIAIPRNLATDSVRITGTDTLYGSFYVSWDPIPSVGGYFVYLYDQNDNSIRLFATGANFARVDSLPVNTRVKAKAAAFILQAKPASIDTITGRKSVFASADIYQPQPPANVRYTYDSTALSVQVLWNKNTSDTVVRYIAYLRNDSGKCIDSAGLGPADTAARFTVQVDRAYKINVRTVSRTGWGILSVVYPYGSADSGAYMLPYLYLSTYKAPHDTMVTGGGGYMKGVQGGLFSMGAVWKDSSGISKDNGKPVHEVRLSSFYLYDKEVTNAQYVRFLNDTGEHMRIVPKADTTPSYVVAVRNTDTTWICVLDRRSPFLRIRYGFVPAIDDTGFFVDSAGYNDYPVCGIYWTGAARYCNWLSSKASLTLCYDAVTLAYDPAADGYRLPTEAEFEYVHSGAYGMMSSKQRYPWGNGFNGVSLALRYTATAQFPPHSGFYDLSGNVKEWCTDKIHSTDNAISESSYYKQCAVLGVVKDPYGPAGTGTLHVCRGGGFLDKQGVHHASCYRFAGPDPKTDVSTGFRIARSKKR